MEELKELMNEYSWLLVTGVALLLFQNTITEAVDGIMIFMGNDYNEDDVVMAELLDEAYGRLEGLEADAAATLIILRN